MSPTTISGKVCAIVAVAILSMTLLGAFSARAAENSLIYLPMLAAGGTTNPPTTPPTTPPAAGSLPAELVGTWFSGNMLSLTLYDRTTGMWSDAGGLGHMYVFGANGSYTLVSYLKLGEGTTCVSSVAKYHTGTVRAVGDQLLLTPSYARTRTQICRSSPVEQEGPYETISVPWRVGEDTYRHTRLWLSEAHGETEYYKDGLAPQVIGAWANGDGGAIELYDPASGAWAIPTGENSEWYQFRADGSYRRGEINAGFGDDPCRQVTMSYEQGALRGSGSELTLQPTQALRHVVSLCDPSDAEDTPLSTKGIERWTWSFKQQAEGMGLSLMRVSAGFHQCFLLPVE
jgi:hypothetical protein